MKRLFLVKKDPEKPAAEDNWIVMEIIDFLRFIESPEGQRRKTEFGRIPGYDKNDVVYYVECGQETAKAWKKEDDHQRFFNHGLGSQYKVLSYFNVETDDETGVSSDLEELITDETVNVEETAIVRVLVERLGLALNKLKADERDLIEKMYMGERPMSERTFAELMGITRSTAHYRKKRVLKKLKNLVDGCL